MREGREGQGLDWENSKHNGDEGGREGGEEEEEEEEGQEFSVGIGGYSSALEGKLF
jgi:hypothetical protein